MASLQEFRVYENSLVGTFPITIGDLTGLTLMMLDNNKLTGIILITFSRKLMSLFNY